MSLRTLIRIAMLVGAWCCGLLFYTFTGKTAGMELQELSLGSWITYWWSSCADILQLRLMNIDMDNDTKSQILALTLGRRSLLSPEIKEMYRTAGGSHLLALSGMHLGVLFSLLNIAVRNLIYGRWRWPAISIAIALVWSYALLTGCPKSLVRAAMMMSVFLVLQATGRDRKLLDVLTLSAAIIIMIDPCSAVDVGFQLSCMAMLGICMLAMPLAKRIGGWPVWKKYICSALAVSVSAQISTLPLTLWYFHSIALYSSATSLIAIPLTTVIIYLSLGLYCGCLWLVPVITGLIWLQNTIMLWIGQLPGAYIVI